MDVLGSHRQLLERGRELSRPEVFKPGGVSATRLAADITGFNGQYQLGRHYFSPFYAGWDAPRTSIQDENGLTFGSALQFDVQNGSYVGDRTPNLVFSPTLLWDGSYKISDNQSITFTGGLQLNVRGDNEQYQTDRWSDDYGFALLPGTSLAYDLELDSLHVTAYDRVSAMPYLGMLQNDVGGAFTLDLTSRLSWTLNYTFSKTYDIDGDFGRYASGINFNQHSISSELVFENSPTLDLGIEGAMTWYRPENEFSPARFFFFPFPFLFIPGEMALRAEFWNSGLFAAWQPTGKTRIRVAAGIQHSRIAGEANPPFFPTTDTQSDTSSPYYSLAISQQLSEAWSHELAAGYENVLGIGGYYSRAHYVNYGVTGTVRDGGQLTASLFYERSHSPVFLGLGSGDPVTLTGVDLHFSQKITSKLAMDMGGSAVCSHVKSNQSDTFQYMAGVGARYALTDRTQLRLNLQGFLWDNAGGTNVTGRILLGIRTEF